MPKFIVNSFDNLIKSRKIIGKNILIFGATFENCNDTRNSKSIELANILSQKFNVDFFDPYVKKKDNKFKNLKSIKNNYYSAFFNVKHKHFMRFNIEGLKNKRG